MRIFADKSPARGQTSIEYLLLLAVVAVVVIASFSSGSLVDQVHNAAGGYYGTASKVIMDSDGYNAASGRDVDSPQPIPGGWCPVSCPPSGSSGFNVIYRACECPPPAFGGASCSGNGHCGPGQTCQGPMVSCNGVSACTCPDGRPCDASGNCAVCSLDCSSIPNSSPDPTCTKCQCNSGTLLNGCALCDPCYTALDGVTCTPVACPSLTTQWCDSSRPSSCECACDLGTIWNGSACTYCQSTAGGECTKPPVTTPLPPGQCPPTTPQTCVPYTCPNTMYCDTTANACKCPSPTTCWNGSACVDPPCTCSPSTACPSTNGCAHNSCGTSCGTCSTGQSCSTDPSGNTPGTCSCPVVLACGPGTPYNCGVDSCGGSCGTCPTGSTCPNPTEPSTCVPCTTPPLCGTDNCGTDGCGDSCGACPAGQCSNLTGGPGTCGCIADPTTCTVPTTVCGSTLGEDNCGDVCVGKENLCPNGDTCDMLDGTCMCGPVCIPYTQCGSSSGYTQCPNGTQPSCTAVPGNCTTEMGPGFECSADDICVCKPSGVCVAKYQCGSTDGVDSNCPNISCDTATTVSCAIQFGRPDFSCTNNVCVCQSDGHTCNPSYMCGSDVGTDNCGKTCYTAPVSDCSEFGPGYSCNDSNQCTCTPGQCPTGAQCGADTCGNAGFCNPNAPNPALPVVIIKVVLTGNAVQEDNVQPEQHAD